jgi:hypothetical protein
VSGFAVFPFPFFFFLVSSSSHEFTLDVARHDSMRDWQSDVFKDAGVDLDNNIHIFVQVYPFHFTDRINTFIAKIVISG